MSIIKTVIAGLYGAVGGLALVGGACLFAPTVAATQGSIFGCSIAAESILGVSATNITRIGLSSATVAGSIWIVVCCIGAAAAYYVYTRRSGNPQHPIQQGYSIEPAHNAQSSQNPIIPEFHPISMTQAQFEQCLIITQQICQEVIQGISCPITHLIMREPVKMNCCWQIKRQNVDKYVAKHEFQNRQRCLLCQNQLEGSFDDNVVLDNSKVLLIQGFRCSLAKTYKQANEQQKERWERFANVHFGEDYTSKHLRTFQISN